MNTISIRYDINEPKKKNKSSLIFLIFFFFFFFSICHGRFSYGYDFECRFDFFGERFYHINEDTAWSFSQLWPSALHNK